MPGESFGPVRGEVLIFGTAESETTIFGDGVFQLDGSFGRGGDIVVLEGASSAFQIRRSGSSAILSSDVTTLTLPVSPAGILVRFDDGEAVLRYDPLTETFALGELSVVSTFRPVVLGSIDPVPIIVLAGQSNAELPGMDHAIYASLGGNGGAFEFVKVAQSSTSLFPNANGQNWDPATGVLFTQLVSDTRAAIANVRAQGGIPQVELLWVQGEADVRRSSASYQAKLTDFIAEFRAAIEFDDARVTIALLPGEDAIREAQQGAADDLSRVRTLETAGTPMIDPVHYTPEGAAGIAQRFLAEADLVPPMVAGYQALLDQTRIDVEGPITIVTVAEFGSITFRETTGSYLIAGGAGADDILTGDATDRIIAAGGADVIDTAGGNDRVEGGHGDDTIRGGAGHDVLLGDWGEDVLFGGSGNDILRGGKHDDALIGEAGDDILIGNAGADIMRGGLGSDVFLYGWIDDSNAAEPDVIRDFLTSHGDRIDLALIDADLATEADDAFSFIGIAAFSGMAGELRVDFEPGQAWVMADADGDGAADLVIRLDAVATIAASDFIL